MHTRTHTVHIKSALLKVGRLYSTCNSHLEVNGMENLCWKMIFWSRVESFAIMAFSSLFSADLTTFTYLKGSQKIQKKMVDSQFLSLASNGLHWPPFTILRSRCDYTFLFVEITFSANVEWPQIAFEATEVNVFFWPLMASIDLGVHLQYWITEVSL